MAKKESDSKVLAGIGISVGAFLAFAMILMMTTETDADQTRKLHNMSSDELGKMVQKWKYSDLINNYTGYQDQIIYISGRVIDYPFLENYVGVQTGCSKVLQFRECDVIFIQTDTMYSLDDKISGYVSGNGLHELISKKPRTGALVGEQVPQVKAIRLDCDLCQSISKEG